jgi:hypothetical protein
LVPFHLESKPIPWKQRDRKKRDDYWTSSSSALMVLFQVVNFALPLTAAAAIKPSSGLAISPS